MPDNNSIPPDEVPGNLRVISEFRDGKDVVGGFFPRAAVLLLTTTGARTRQPRTWPVLRFDVDGALVVVASAAGRDRHPAWYHNLLTHPAAVVELWNDDRLESFEAVATPAVPEERDRLWHAVVAQNPQIGGYQTMTDRMLPVLHLRRAIPGKVFPA